MQTTRTSLIELAAHNAILAIQAYTDLRAALGARDGRVAHARDLQESATVWAQLAADESDPARVARHAIGAAQARRMVWAYRNDVFRGMRRHRSKVDDLADQLASAEL